MKQRYDDKENFNRVIRFAKPSHIPMPIPSRGLMYHGAWAPDVRPSPDTRQWQDLWGVTWTDCDGEVFPTGPAITSFEGIDTFHAPDPLDPARFAGVAAQIAGIDRSRFFVSSNHPYFLYEKGINIMGAAEFLMLLLADPDRANRLLDMIVEFELGIARQYAKFKPDHINLSDDYGMQSSLVMSPDVWREYFKPRLKRVIDFYRSELGPDIVVSHHSCGHVMPILEDFIEIGVNVLNPVQSTANDLALMRRITAGRLTLAGGIDGQRVLPSGTPQEVRSEVLRKCDLLWQDGGYLPMAEKMLGVPKENEEAMNGAIAEWSRLHVENGTPA